jgi:hypothetical protein
MPASPLPLLRSGGWYTSLDQSPAPGPALPPISLASEVLLRRDARRLRTAELAPAPEPATRAAILAGALALFTTGTVDCGGLGAQSAAGFRAALWRSAGLPVALVDRWCAMLADQLAVLTAAAPPKVPEAGAGSRARFTLVSLPANTFTCLESVLAALWAGDLTWVRPSTREPLSALRLVSALVQAGWPSELIGFYPTRPDRLPVLAAITDRQVLYGGAELAAAVGKLPSAQWHGPMRVGAVVAEDADPDEAAAALLPLVASEGGRFCTTTRAIFCRADPAPLAGRLARLLDAIPFRPDGISLPLAASQDPARATATAAAVTSRLGARDLVLTARPVVSNSGGLTYLAPTLVRLADERPVSEPEWGRPSLLGFEAPFPLATIMRVTSEQEARLTRAADVIHRVGDAGELAAAEGGSP